MNTFQDDVVAKAFETLSEQLELDSSSPVTYGLPDLLSIKNRKDQETAIKDFVESKLMAVKKGRASKIILIPQMVEFLTDMFYGYEDSAILWKPRGSGGSVMAALVVWLKACYQRMPFYILSGSKKQSGHIYEYVCGFFSCIEYFRDAVLKKRPGQDKVVFKNGVEIIHVPASENASIGEQVPGLVIDEASSSDKRFERLIERAVPIVESSNPKCIVACSTFHHASGWFQHCWDSAEEIGYKRYRYDIYDAMKKCEEPIDCKECFLTEKIIQIDSSTNIETTEYEGCNGKARTSSGFKNYADVCRTKKRNPTVWPVEYECKRPGQEHKIYPKDILDRCLVDEIRIFRTIPFEMVVGIDWGWSSMCAITFLILQDQIVNLVGALYVRQTLVAVISSIIENEIAKYSLKKHQIECWCDAENPFGNSELEERGFDVQPVPFGTYKGYAITNLLSWMRTGRFKMLRSYPKSGKTFYKQMEAYMKDPDTGKPVKQNDHFPDSIAAGALRFNFLESGLVEQEELEEDETESRIIVL